MKKISTETKYTGKAKKKTDNNIIFYIGVRKNIMTNRGVAIVVYNNILINIKSWQEIDE